MLLGTGTAGAYHAGALRALLEAGVRLDLVAGRGIGAVSALFAAVDAASRLWDANGLWRGRPGPRRLYQWRRSWLLLGGSVLVGALLLALPLVGLSVLALAYPLLLPVQLISPDAGAAALARWRDVTAWVAGPDIVASLIPRLVTMAVLVAAAVALGVHALSRWKEGPTRAHQGALWWRAMGAPFDASRAVTWAIDGFWQYMRGAAAISQPTPPDLGRRYAELLSENFGQPGYRELILLAHDLDARRDVVFALLSDTWRKRLATRAAQGALAELVDLAGASSIHVIDAVAAALAPPVVCEPHLVAYAAESYWRGETHRMCDRPSAVTRLLHEVAEAGATQVIIVSSVPSLQAPHGLRRPGADPRERIGETLESVEAAALADAVTALAARFSGVFHIRLAHNPVGAFAFAGSADERSQRAVALDELVDRGYEDAYRQFLEPVIGASGEQMHGATVVGPTPQPADLPLRPS